MFGLTGPLQPDFCRIRRRRIPLKFATCSAPMRLRCSKTRHFLYFLLCATLISRFRWGPTMPTPLTLAGRMPAAWRMSTPLMSFGQMSGNRVYAGDPAAVSPSRGQSTCCWSGWWRGLCAMPIFARRVSEGRFLLYPGIAAWRVLRLLFVVGFIYTDRVAESRRGAKRMIVMFTYAASGCCWDRKFPARCNANQLVAGQTDYRRRGCLLNWIPAVAAAVIALIFPFSFQVSRRAALTIRRV